MQLFAEKRKIFTKRAVGQFRNFKYYLTIVSLAIYYITPWLRWNRGAGAPDQAVLVDLVNRRFYFFFIEIWPQEFFIVAILLILAGVGLFWITSVLGRAWCGYMCPQTVWVDLFMLIEESIEGDRNQRIKLHNAQMGLEKIFKRCFKHASWIFVSFMTGGAWVFYFTDTPSMYVQLLLWQAPIEVYYTITLLTATTYFLGGLMREQVCIYMCPWPRIQSAMMDEYSWVVGYNNQRGEPRRAINQTNTQAMALDKWVANAMGKTAINSDVTKQEGAKKEGDCINCNLCVAVCPMGIDIRDGQQLACISCALCVDACNGVMEKLHRPKDLIGYNRLKTDKKPWQRPRFFIYALLFALLGGVILVYLLGRSDISAHIVHDRNPEAVQLKDGTIRNGYRLNLLNMHQRQRPFTINAHDLKDSKIILENGDIVDMITMEIAAGESKEVRFFVVAPKPSQLNQPFTINITSDDGKTHPIQTQFIGIK